MLLYGEPGVGKSTFACKAPKPFFITTDGNYEWLEDFGAKPEAHRQVFSWTEAKDAFAQAYDGYETIVVDLLEDMFKWCEYDYCTRAKLEHVSDIGYGKGYDITRNEFFLEISKLLGKNKHIILITHGVTYVTKDRRGVEHTKHGPSNRIPDKVMDMIEGRLRYCLRCYLKAEEQSDGTILKKRVLSVVPKENEFGIARGLDENAVPHDIPLDFAEFARVIGLNVNAKFEDMTEVKLTPAPEKAKIAKASVKAEPVETIKIPEPQPSIEKYVEQENIVVPEKEGEPDPEVKIEEKDSAPWEEPKKEEAQPIKTEQPQEQSKADKIAAIKAKLAGVKKINRENN